MQRYILTINHSEQARRKLLLAAMTGFGGIGLLAAALPFIKGMSPSEAAKAAAAPVGLDTSQVKPGQLQTVEWRGKPVWILHRTEEMLAGIDKHDGLLADPRSTKQQQPAYASNPTRSIKPAFLVVTGICTHLGCVPGYRPDAGASDLGADWPGGFYCPCHGSKFDLAGRVFKNVPAPLNLEVPPHSYSGDTQLMIGADERRS